MQLKSHCTASLQNSPWFQQEMFYLTYKIFAVEQQHIITETKD